jgi:hypothetical protein
MRATIPAIIAVALDKNGKSEVRQDVKVTRQKKMKFPIDKDKIVVRMQWLPLPCGMFPGEHCKGGAKTA